MQPQQQVSKAKSLSRLNLLLTSNLPVYLIELLILYLLQSTQKPSCKHLYQIIYTYEECNVFTTVFVWISRQIDTWLFRFSSICYIYLMTFSSLRRTIIIHNESSKYTPACLILFRIDKTGVQEFCLEKWVHRFFK